MVLGLAICLPIISIVWCASPEEQAAREQQRQAADEQSRKNAFRSLIKKCEGYGFQRGTTPFAQCLQQAEAQKKMDEAVKLQADELARQDSARRWRKAQCYASGRLDC